MSETKHYRGKLFRVQHKKNETLQDVAKKILDKTKINISESDFNYYKGDYVKILCDIKNDDFIEIDGHLFSIIAHEIDPYSYILDFDIDETTRGAYDFECRFHNGGTCLREMLEEGYKRLHKS